MSQGCSHGMCEGVVVVLWSSSSTTQRCLPAIACDHAPAGNSVRPGSWRQFRKVSMLSASGRGSSSRRVAVPRPRPGNPKSPTLALRSARCIARHPAEGRCVPPRGTRRFVTLWGLGQTAAGAFAASDAAGLVGPHGDLDAVSGAELSHEAGEVGFDGARGDVELAGDLIVRAALGYRHEDFLLAGGERFYRLPRWGGLF